MAAPHIAPWPPRLPAGATIRTRSCAWPATPIISARASSTTARSSAAASTSIPRRSPPTRAWTISRSASAGAPSSWAPRRCAAPSSARAGGGTSVDFLATTTCTGRVCPSLDAQIIAELGLAPRSSACTWATPAAPAPWSRSSRRPTTSARFPVTARWSSPWSSAPPPTTWTTGSRARWPTRSSPTARAPSRWPAPATGPAIVEHRTLFRSEHLPAMGFEYPGGRPRVVLSKEVRRIGGDMMKEMADTLMAPTGSSRPTCALRAALGGAAGDRAGAEAHGARRGRRRALPPRAARVRQHVLRHRRLRPRRGAAERAGRCRATGVS